MIKRKFSYTRDILPVFLLCAALVSLVSLIGKEKSDITFDSAFRSSASLLGDQQRPSSKPVKSEKNEEYREIIKKSYEKRNRDLTEEQILSFSYDTSFYTSLLLKTRD